MVIASTDTENTARKNPGSPVVKGPRRKEQRPWQAGNKAQESAGFLF